MSMVARGCKLLRIAITTLRMRQAVCDPTGSVVRLSEARSRCRALDNAFDMFDREAVTISTVIACDSLCAEFCGWLCSAWRSQLWTPRKCLCSVGLKSVLAPAKSAHDVPD